jgi:hypothetical protein
MKSALQETKASAQATYLRILQDASFEHGQAMPSWSPQCFFDILSAPGASIITIPKGQREPSNVKNGKSREMDALGCYILGALV